MTKRYKITTDEASAIITHYLQNENSRYAHTYAEEAERLLYPDDDVRTDCVAEESFQYGLFGMDDVPFPPPEKYRFTFIDLFAGIGGFRMAFQNLGGKCVFSSEWDEQAKKTYLANYGEVPFGDITKERTKNFIPNDFDILCAGFPCQAFSLAGKRLGFAETRGTLFFDVADILKRHQPKAFFLENVKGLVLGKF